MKQSGHLDLLPGQRFTYQNGNPRASSITITTAGGDIIELTLHPGAEFSIRPAGPAKLTTDNRDTNLIGLHLVDPKA